MDEVLVIPDDLEACQRLLRELLSAHVELSRTCESLRASQEKLEQENQEQQWTIKALLRELYGRRSERFVEGRGQQHLDFGDDAFLGTPPSSPPPSRIRSFRSSWCVAARASSHEAKSCRIIWNVGRNASSRDCPRESSWQIVS